MTRPVMVITLPKALSGGQTRCKWSFWGISYPKCFAVLLPDLILSLLRSLCPLPSHYRRLPSARTLLHITFVSIVSFHHITCVTHLSPVFERYLCRATTVMSNDTEYQVHSNRLGPKQLICELRHVCKDGTFQVKMKHNIYIISLPKEALGPVVSLSPALAPIKHEFEMMYTY